MNRAIAIILVSALGVAAGCGQKGPLYLPGQPKQNAPWPPPAQPAAAPEPTPRPADVPASNDSKK